MRHGAWDYARFRQAEALRRGGAVQAIHVEDLLGRWTSVNVDSIRRRRLLPAVVDRLESELVGATQVAWPGPSTGTARRAAASYASTSLWTAGPAPPPAQPHHHARDGIHRGWTDDRRPTAASTSTGGPTSTGPPTPNPRPAKPEHSSARPAAGWWRVRRPVTAHYHRAVRTPAATRSEPDQDGWPATTAPATRSEPMTGPRSTRRWARSTSTSRPRWARTQHGPIDIGAGHRYRPGRLRSFLRTLSGPQAVVAERRPRAQAAVMGSSNVATNAPVPHSVEAEAAVLGTMLQLGGYGQAACRAALAGLCAEDFYSPAHGQLFEAVARLLDAGHPPDVGLVVDQLRRDGLVQTAAHVTAMVVSLLAEAPAASGAARWVQIVAELADQRHEQAAALELAQAAAAGDETGRLRARETLERLAQDGPHGRRPGSPAARHRRSRPGRAPGGFRSPRSRAGRGHGDRQPGSHVGRGRLAARPVPAGGRAREWAKAPSPCRAVCGRSGPARWCCTCRSSSPPKTW